MKNIKSLFVKIPLFIIVVLVAGFFASVNTASAQVATPSCACNPEPDCTSAVVYGKVDIFGNLSTSIWFEWGESSSLGNRTSTQTSTSSGEFSAKITGLKENTTYYYRIMASNSAGDSAGQTKTFKTLLCSEECEGTVIVRVVDQDGRSMSASWYVESTLVDGSGYDVSGNNSGGSYTLNASSYRAGGYDVSGYSGPSVYPQTDVLSKGGSITFTLTYTKTTTSSTCTDPSATNYGGSLPCKYPSTVCTDTSATNYGGSLPCKYPSTICTNTNAINYGGSLPCRFQTGNSPSVSISANPSSIDSGDSSTLTWDVDNADSCTASGGWSGSKSASGGSASTGSLYSNKTYYITCANSDGSDSDSVTVYVGSSGNNGDEPEANTDSADDIQDDSAKIKGDIDMNDYDNGLVFFVYGQDEDQIGDVEGDYDTYGDIDEDGDNLQKDEVDSGLDDSESYSLKITNLDEDTDYYYSICVQYENEDNDDQLVCGDVEDFNTDGSSDNNNGDEPEVTTKSATSISSSYATLNGRVDGNGSSVKAWFEYGTDKNLSDETSEKSYGSGSSSYNARISGLRSNTTYYFRAVAENDEGDDYGSIFSFRTTGGSVVDNDRPTVGLSADQGTVSYNGSTSLRWYSTNATSCYASGGSTGWSGAKSIGPASFYTGSLTGTRTYSITCSNSSGSATDSVTVNVRGQTINKPTTKTSMVLISSSVDRNQPIVPTIDNTRPHPGDYINYTVNYQNIGTGAITNLTLRIILPSEVDYITSKPNNPNILGNNLIFNLGTLKANGEGEVTVKVRVQDNVYPGINLDFPAILSYIDPSGDSQSVDANVSAQVWEDLTTNTNETVSTNRNIFLGANAFGAGFLPTTLFGWLFLLILILILIFLARYVYASNQVSTFDEETIAPSREQNYVSPSVPFRKKTTTTTVTME